MRPLDRPTKLIRRKPLKHDRLTPPDYGERLPMTVCIAAICNYHTPHPFVVGACDRMITIGDIEYEPDQTKLVQVASHAVILIAGQMRLHATACKEIFKRFHAAIGHSILIKEIAELYANEFAAFRRYNAERAILSPLNMTFDQFVNNQSGMSGDFVIHTSRQLQEYYIEAEAIVAGLDSQGIHLYKILDPGMVVDCGTECFAAIGIGESHAISQFMVARFVKGWSVPDTLTLSMIAKQRAESNAGVGNATDLFMIGKGGVRKLENSIIDNIKEILREKDEKDAANYQAASESVSNQIGDIVNSLLKPITKTPDS
jgi:20S proteasome alpha/beta subunit